MPLPPFSQWTFGQIIIGIIICAACIAVLYAALGALGVAIPPLAITVFWIVVIACIAILGIKLLLSLWG